MTELRQAVKAPSHLSGGDPGGLSQSVKRSVGGVASLLGLRNGFRGRAEIRSPYRESGWVHACLKPIGQAVAQVPLEFWTADPALDKRAERLPPDHPLNTLFSAPNPLHTQAQFFDACAINMKLDGINAWLMTDAMGNPIAGPIDPERPITEQLDVPVPSMIMPYRGRSIAFTTNKFGWPTEYMIGLWGGGSQRVSPRTLVIFRDYDPDNPVGGLSDVDAALSDIDLDWQAQRYQRAIIENSGDPGGWIQVEGQLAQPEEKALKNEAKEEFRVDKAGEWRILTGQNVKYVPNKMTPRDMEFRSLQEWTRDKIAAILGVPPPIIGVLDNATLANFEQCVRMFWLGGNGVLAYVKSVEDVINGHFLRRIKKDRTVPPTVVARFNTSGVKALQENKQLQLEIAQKLAAANIGLSIHDALKLVGIETEPLKFGDVHLVPSTLVPIENVIAGDTVPSKNDPAADPADGEPADQPADDSAKAQPAAVTRDEGAPADEPSAEDEAFKARSLYWETREATFARKGRATIKAKYLRWSKRYEAAQIKRIKDFAKNGQAALRSVAKDTLDPLLDPTTLTPEAVDPLLLDVVQWQKSMRTALETTLRDIFDDASSDMADELGTAALSMEEPSVIAFLERQVIKLVENHTNTLAELVRGALLEGLKQATSIGTLQQMVLEVLPELEGSLKKAFADREGRALTIARTETGEASSGARRMEMVAAGVDESEWISSRDQNVRGTPGGPYEDAKFSHYELDGKVTPLGVEFDPVKHPGLKHPHDPDAQAGDKINCRCYERPKRKEA